MTAILLAAASALVYGVSDFVGGLRSRQAHYIWVTLVSQAALTTCVALWSLVRPGVPTGGALAWGALAAVGHVFGTLMLMRGLSSGAMHVAGPLSAVVGAAIPVLVGVLGGERPSALSWIGIAAALPAVWLVASGESAEPDVAGGPGVASGPGKPGVQLDATGVRSAGDSAPSASTGTTGRLPAGARDGVLAGLGFALFFVALSKPEASAGAWPVLTLEVTALVMVAAIALVVRPPGRLADGRGGWLVGLLGFLGVLTYYLATQEGLLSIVAVVTSLYPAFTVGLAMLVLHERPVRRQLVGLAAAAMSVVLIAVGGH